MKIEKCDFILKLLAHVKEKVGLVGWINLQFYLS